MSETVTSQMATVMARAANAINLPASVEERLEAVVLAATDTVPGCDHASISVAHGDKAPETRAASSELVRELDRLQYEVEEGPCYEALSCPGIVLVPSLRHEQRWPRYVSPAADAGITAQMAVHLLDQSGLQGSLNLYRTTGEGIDPEAPGIAVLFASHAASALGRADVEQNLNHALVTRKMIGQAIGIVMERYQVNEAMAFGFLTRVSQTGNLKLRDVAAELVTLTDTKYTVKDA